MWKLISADVKANVEQKEIKELVAVTFVIFIRGAFKTWNTI